MILAVLCEEVLIHAFVGCNLGDVRFELGGRKCELRVEDEALVVGEQRDDVVVARDEPDRRLAVEPGLQVHGTLLPHACVRLVGRHPELVAVQVVASSGRHAGAMMSRREPQADARIRRDGLSRLGAAARASHGRRSGSRRTRRAVSLVGGTRRRRAHRLGCACHGAGRKRSGRGRSATGAGGAMR